MRIAFQSMWGLVSVAAWLVVVPRAARREHLVTFTSLLILQIRLEVNPINEGVTSWLILLSVQATLPQFPSGTGPTPVTFARPCSG